MNSYKILKIDGTKITVQWTINGITTTDTLDGRHLLNSPKYIEVVNENGEKEFQLVPDVREHTLEDELMRQLNIMVGDANQDMPVVGQAEELVGQVKELVVPEVIEEVIPEAIPEVVEETVSPVTPEVTEVAPEVIEEVPVAVAPEVTDLVGVKVDIVVPDPVVTE
jgi:hypothetical protein